MGLSDYRLCDICNQKTFHDIDLYYDFENKDGFTPFLIAGKKQGHFF